MRVITTQFSHYYCVIVCVLRYGWMISLCIVPIFVPKVELGEQRVKHYNLLKYSLCTPDEHTPTSPLIAKLHRLRIPQRIQYKILTIVFNSIHKEAPQYINELLHTYESTYHLRSSKRTSLVIPKTHKRAGDRSFSYIAPKLWNSLPPSLANKPSNSLFKKHLKSHLFQ